MQLIVEHLSVQRGARTILTEVTFRLAAGEAMLLTGRNGAGKTTLIRTIAGLLRPVAGEIRIAGGREEAEVAEQCHYIGHLNGIKTSLTAQENLTFWAAFLAPGDARSPGERALDALDALEIGALADIPAGYLSAGQKRRLGLARLFVAPRPVWLLDEPTVSLDAASTALLARLVNDHVAGGGLALAATHLPLGLAKTRELRLGAGAEAA